MQQQMQQHLQRNDKTLQLIITVIEKRKYMLHLRIIYRQISKDCQNFDKDQKYLQKKWIFESNKKSYQKMQHLQQKQKQSIQTLQKTTTVISIRSIIENGFMKLYCQIINVKRIFN